MPTWPQMVLISAFGMAAIVFGYYLSRMREDWGSAAWAMLALLVISGAGFVATVYMFYIRPQHGARAFPFLLAFLLGHVALVALLWRIGVFG
jgi:hypothetical protein